MHISSLPSEYGIGTLGMEAYRFVDFLCETGQKYWQVLPIGPTSYGDSPYQSPSAFAGNPYFIDLPTLEAEGLIFRDEYIHTPFGSDPERVDFGAVYYYRNILFERVCDRFSEDRYHDFSDFCRENRPWLDDYALFMSLKEENGSRSWNEFPEELKFHREDAVREAERRLARTIRKYKILQFFFFKQWKSLREYANSKGIRIIGDMPIYVAYDSSDVWASPYLFYLDKELYPTRVAGCPPDSFSELGQRWGNPLYDWHNKKIEVFDWWSSRILHATRLFDIIRIDHFRAFADYYTIPANESTAVNGTWEKGPGIEFFNFIQAKLGRIYIIAEDLGFLTDKVTNLLKETGFPGMRVLQFAFENREDNIYLPHNYDKNSVVYLGTHDNNTLLGWIEESPLENVRYARKYLMINEESDVVEEMISSALSSVSDTVIISIQDLLKTGKETRMNTPSIEKGNWTFRVSRDYLSKINTEWLKEKTKLYFR